MKSSKARALMEQYIHEFLALFPEHTPAEPQRDVSPIFALGMAEGLAVDSAYHYVNFLRRQGYITAEEWGGLLAVVQNTDRVVTRIASRAEEREVPSVWATLYAPHWQWMTDHPDASPPQCPDETCFCHLVPFEESA